MLDLKINLRKGMLYPKKLSYKLKVNYLNRASDHNIPIYKTKINKTNKYNNT